MTKELLTRISQLEAENAILRLKVEFLEKHSKLAAGMRGETLIARLTNGQMTAYNESHDVETKGGVKIEVKMSRLSDHYKVSGTKRWQWHKVFGESGNKTYDFAILIGDSDYRYSHLYRNHSSPYVIFCVPLDALREISDNGYLGFSTNPKQRSSKGNKMFLEYQVTEPELETRFGV